MDELNYLSLSNNAKIINCSSQTKSCGPSNVLSNDRKSIWLSESGLPQHLIIDISQINKKPREFKCFGIYCWHAYNTNPKLIELYFSKDNKSYVYFGKFSISLVFLFLKQKPGTQYFAIDSIDPNVYKAMKIVVKETYGGIKTYINQVYLHEDIPEVENKKSINDSRKSFSSNHHQNGVKPKVVHDLKKELVMEDRMGDNDIDNQKHFETDSEDTLHNSPQKMCNIHDLSRISKEIKPIPKKEVRTDSNSQSFEMSKNYSLSVKKEKELDEKAFDGISINNHSYIHNKASLTDQNIQLTNKGKNEDKHNKTLEDQLKDMESHLMKLKLDQSSDNVIKSIVGGGKHKSFTISDEKFTKEKDNLTSKLGFLNNKGNQNLFSLNSDNPKSFIGDDLKKSNSQYSLLTNKAIIPQSASLEDKIAKLEKELAETRKKCDNLQEEIDLIKKNKSSVSERNLETLLGECKNYINSLLKKRENENKDEEQYNPYKTANYNRLNDREKIFQTQTNKNNSFDINENNRIKDELKKPTDNIEKSKNRAKIELTSILENKFDSLAKSIEEKISTSLLKPTISNLEKNLKSNIEDLREKINSINTTQNKVNSTFRPSNFQKDDREIYDNDKFVNPSKLENIQTIAEKLHEKLTEKVKLSLKKERKLNLLQQQTNSYLKGKKNILASPSSMLSDNY